MQVNQDMAVRQYTQTMQAVSADKEIAAVQGTAQKENTAGASKGKTEPDTDKVEFSRDANVTKMSASERASLVNSLKEDLANQMSRFTNMMTQMFQKQGISASMAQGGDFWRTIASGNFTVDAQTKAEAQEAISENGFWGVSQTSQRIFDFAAAVAGKKKKKMKEMQAAVEKGFKQAGAAWGGSLPSICDETHSAVSKLFDEYYASRG